jgi:hypothetical protein
MRTTIRLDDELLNQAKAYAARSGKTLTAVISDALRETIGRYEVKEQREYVILPVGKGDGLLPGVDLDDTASLLDLMEAADDE